MAGGPDDLVRRPLPAELARLLHDLRGPLNSVVMHVEVLKRSVAGDDTAGESVRTVLQQLARLAEMLPAAFAVTALEAGARRRLDLRAVVDRARERHGAPEVVVADGAWPAVVGDEDLLAFAIGHLLRNALEASPAAARPPEASVNTAPGGEVRLTVRDWGRGLPSTNPRLLVRLLHSTKPGHAGLGLLAVERIARLHAGTLAFETAAGTTAVTLTLPRAE